MSGSEGTDRVRVASRTSFRVRVVLRDGYTGDFDDLAAAVWSGCPEVMGHRAWAKPGEPWRVLLLTLDITANRQMAERVAALIAGHGLVEVAEVLEDTATIWSDATFLQAETAKLNPGLYSRLVLLFFVHDPVGINFEENTDEYEPEVRTVLPRLPSATNAEDVGKILYEEFLHWFGTSAGPSANYKRLAEDVWREWQDRPGTRS